MRDPIVGIDLGTSNSVVAHADAAGVVKVLADDAGYKIHPSVVSFHPNGGVIVGAGAKQRKVIDPANTVYSVKRLIGRGYNSPEVQTARSRVPYRIKQGPNQAPMIVTRSGEFAVPEISAIVLDHMRSVASSRLDAQVGRAVITVPASFNDAQRSATATAGAIAGLTVLRVLNEPTAAALAYGHTRHLQEVIAVYDFGGGTFDITLLALRDQVYEVLGTAGDTFLGGDDLDERLVDKMVAKFLAEHRIDLRTNEVAMMRLRAVAEQTKIELSRRSRAVVRIDEIAYGPGGAPLNLHIEITRDEFVSHVADIIDRTFPVCEEALAIAGIGIDAISDVILVGGTTKIPYVRDQASRFFNRAPRTDVNPDDAVALGAALQATALDQMLSRPHRKVSREIPAVEAAAAAAAEESTTTTTTTNSVTDALPLEERSGAVTMVPTDELLTGLPRVPPPPSPGQRPVDKPDTSYRVTRGGARDEVGDTTRPGITAESFDSRTPPGTAPLGRLKGTQTPPQPPPVVKKTAFGVPAGPRPPPIPPTTQPGVTATPPPIPARALTATSEETTAQGTIEDRSTVTKPLAPAAAIAPPTAPTLVALAPDFATEVESASEVAPASTARGMGPAQPPPISEGMLEFPDTPMPAFAPPEPAFAPAAPAAAPTLAFLEPLTAAPAPRPTPLLLEVTPRGLGIATIAGYCEELIRRNSRVPAEMKRVFTTSRDRQDTVRIVVCQGESRRLDNNTIIGDLVLSNLPPRPRGETAIEVTFALDASGILQVSARDAQTGAEQHASLDLVGGVPQQQVAVSRDRVRALRR